MQYVFLTRNKISLIFLAILFNILHPIDWHIVIFCKVHNFLVCIIFFFHFLKIINFEQNAF